MSRAVKIGLGILVLLVVAFLIFALWGHGEGGSAGSRAWLTPPFGKPLA